MNLNTKMIKFKEKEYVCTVLLAPAVGRYFLSCSEGRVVFYW